MKSVEIKRLKPSSPGTSRHLKILRYGTPGAAPKAYLQASLHADELPGMMAALDDRSPEPVVQPYPVPEELP